MAALSSIHHALSATADGASYVWHRDNGRLSGLVRPTSSFKSAEGSVCRHLVVLLTTGEKTRKTEGIACRAANGVWSLEG
jgi:surface antigen